MPIVHPTKQINILKQNGKHEVFDVDKFRGSLLRAGATTEAIESVTGHIVGELEEGMSTSEIYQRAFTYLHDLEKPVAKRYSLRRAIMELGPTGFPFEDFVAEILRSKGYEAVPRQTVLGGCVPHEVDVVAWNSKKLIMCEAKFHNLQGTKSDLKVALYVKARFDDLKQNVYSYGGTERKLDEGWLITNTKFSSTAIQYGACQNLTMIGWNYPEKGSLQDMVVEAKLHPITALTTISADDKKLLVQNGIVLCSTLKAKPELLSTVLPHVNAAEVINEINEL